MFCYEDTGKLALRLGNRLLSGHLSQALSIPNSINTVFFFFFFFFFIIFINTVYTFDSSKCMNCHSHGDWKTWKMKIVIEKSWNMKNWPKVMKFCNQSWNMKNFVPKFYQICIFFVSAKKLSSNLESPHFPMFSAKCCECRIGKRDGPRKSRNGHGKVMDKYFVKYVGTLSFYRCLGI